MHYNAENLTLEMVLTNEHWWHQAAVFVPKLCLRCFVGLLQLLHVTKIGALDYWGQHNQCPQQGGMGGSTNPVWGTGMLGDGYARENI